MRNLIFGAAALLAVAAPSMAAAQTTGYAGVTWASVDVDGADTDDVLGVEGAVAFEGSSSISFELDAAYADSDNSDSVWSGTAHVFTRNDDYLFGGFVGVTDSDTTTWTAGLEANKYFTNWTLAGAVAYANNDDVDVDGWGVNAQARYFVSDNFRLQANAGWASVDSGAGGDDDATLLGVGGEYQFSAIPISIGANYGHIDTDGGDADTWSLAVRYNFGGTTLKDRDRHGASQADIAGLGAFSGAL
jgi:hypothetical protein